MSKTIGAQKKTSGANVVEALLKLNIGDFKKTFATVGAISNFIGLSESGVFVPSETYRLINELAGKNLDMLCAVMFVSAVSSAKGPKIWEKDFASSGGWLQLKMVYSAMKGTHLRYNSVTLCYPTVIARIAFHSDLTKGWKPYGGPLPDYFCMPGLWGLFKGEESSGTWANEYFQFLVKHSMNLKKGGATKDLQVSSFVDKTFKFAKLSLESNFYSSQTDEALLRIVGGKAAWVLSDKGLDATKAPRNTSLDWITAQITVTLTYNGTAAWLDGPGVETPEQVEVDKRTRHAVELLNERLAKMKVAKKAQKIDLTTGKIVAAKKALESAETKLEEAIEAEEEGEDEAVFHAKDRVAAISEMIEDGTISAEAGAIELQKALLDLQHAQGLTPE